MFYSYVVLVLCLTTASLISHEANAYSVDEQHVKHFTKRSAGAESVEFAEAEILVENITSEIELRPPKFPNKETHMCPFKYSCVDCSTVRICGNRANGSIVETTVRCNPETPFCNEQTGTCDSEPARIDLCDEKVNPSFVCQTDGYYPNPDTNSRFFICYQGYAFSLACSDNHYFNMDTNVCSGRLIEEYSSGPFDCKKYNGRKVKHVYYDRYYAYCIEGKVSVIDKCGVNYRFDTDSQSCQPSNHDSSKLVYIPDIRDCRKYFTKFFGAKAITPRICADGFYFDSFMASCVPDKSVCLSREKYNL